MKERVEGKFDERKCAMNARKNHFRGLMFDGRQFRGLGGELCNCLVVKTILKLSQKKCQNCQNCQFQQRHDSELCNRLGDFVWTRCRSIKKRHCMQIGWMLIQPGFEKVTRKYKYLCPLRLWNLDF